MRPESSQIYEAPEDPWAWAMANVGLIHKRIDRHPMRAALERVDREDLVQEGIIVAVKAIQTYTPGAGTSEKHPQGASVQSWVSKLVHQALARLAIKAARQQEEVEKPVEMWDVTASSTREREAALDRVREWARAQCLPMGLDGEAEASATVEAVLAVSHGASLEDASDQYDVPVWQIEEAMERWEM